MVHHGQTVYSQGRPMGSSSFSSGWAHTCTNTFKKGQPPLFFHRDFLLLYSIYPACALASLSEMDTSVAFLGSWCWRHHGYWLPRVNKTMSFLAWKHWSPKFQGLHSCLIFKIRWITTNYVVIIMSWGKILPHGKENMGIDWQLLPGEKVPCKFQLYLKIRWILKKFHCQLGKSESLLFSIHFTFWFLHSFIILLKNTSCWQACSRKVHAWSPLCGAGHLSQSIG